MGRIKPTLVKRTSKNLLKLENKFDGTFDHNKKLLGNSMPSKKIRNKIAGYLARLKLVEEKEKDK
ncbi:MAG: 30S ribosomal protein S17e [Nanoarchaeota archaeon]|nr:30S ribosomal protein S17e [Nanoarchaeota archaeon]